MLADLTFQENGADCRVHIEFLWQNSCTFPWQNIAFQGPWCIRYSLFMRRGTSFSGGLNRKNLHSHLPCGCSNNTGKLSLSHYSQKHTRQRIVQTFFFKILRLLKTLSRFKTSRTFPGLEFFTSNSRFFSTFSGLHDPVRAFALLKSQYDFVT